MDAAADHTGSTLSGSTVLGSTVRQPTEPQAVRRVRSDRPAAIDALADLTLGATCPGCGRAGWGCCPGCRGELDAGPRWRQLGDLGVVALADYRPPVSNLVKRWKDDQAWTLVGVFARPMAGLLGRLGIDDRVVLVPVPSSRPAVRRRHYDHTAALARAVVARAAGAGLHCGWRRALVRRGPVRDQRQLDRSARLTNQRSTMRVTGGSRPPPGCVVLVIDDVVTTGATLTEAIRRLAAAGWPVIGALTVASTSLTSGRGDGIGRVPPADGARGAG